jgi:hypothetical protein
MLTILHKLNLGFLKAWEKRSRFLFIFWLSHSTLALSVCLLDCSLYLTISWSFLLSCCWLQRDSKRERDLDARETDSHRGRKRKQESPRASLKSGEMLKNKAIFLSPLSLSLSLPPSLYLTLSYNPHCLEKLCPCLKERHLSKDSFLLAMSKLF